MPPSMHGVRIAPGRVRGAADPAAAGGASRRDSYDGLLRILRDFIAKDLYTSSHCERVTTYAARIAMSFSLSADRLEDLRAAAAVHDIGKLEIDRALLYKASPLSAAEYDAMQQHVPRGAEILELVGGPMQRLVPIVLAHHDKYDGSGYNPAKGNDIPLEARILAVADVYDSLTSDRPYRAAMTSFAARYVIRQGTGTEFDPLVVAAFENALERGMLTPSPASSAA